MNEGRFFGINRNCCVGGAEMVNIDMMKGAVRSDQYSVIRDNVADRG